MSSFSALLLAHYGAKREENIAARARISHVDDILIDVDDHLPLHDRPVASEALAAALLDRTGIDPRSLRSGVTLITARSEESAKAVTDLLRTVVLTDARRPTDDTRAMSPSTVVVASASVRETSGGWFVHAYERGAAIVQIVERMPEELPQMLDVVDRGHTLPAIQEPGILSDVIELVTGDRLHLRPSDYHELTWGEVLLSVRPGDDGNRALERLRRLRERRGDERRGLVDQHRQLTASLRREPEPEPDSEPVRLDSADEDVVVRLSQMTGFGDAKSWGLQLAADIRDFRDGRLAWRDLDRGALLSGPPGTGKSTFARALALEAGVSLVSTTYADWQGVGNGDSTAKGMTKLFATWRKRADAESALILLIDEIDSIGARGMNGHNESWFVTQINTLLSFLDGPTPRTGIVVIATTNHAERVDPALRRPGRLDRHITIPLPDVDALRGIVRRHLGADAVVIESELLSAAKACRGRSPADVEQIVRQARRNARTFRRLVCALDVVDAIDLGRERRLEADDRSIAIHEAGHVVVARALGRPPHSVDMDSPEGAHAFIPTRVTGNATAEDLGVEMTIALGGRAAEDALLGAVASGAIGDLRAATAIASSMHCLLGMGDFGLVAIAPEYAATRRDVEQAVRATLDQAYDRALSLCRAHRGDIERLSQALVRDRYLDAAEIEAALAPRVSRLRGLPDAIEQQRAEREGDDGYGEYIASMTLAA